MTIESPLQILLYVLSQTPSLDDLVATPESSITSYIDRGFPRNCIVRTLPISHSDDKLTDILLESGHNPYSIPNASKVHSLLQNSSYESDSSSSSSSSDSDDDESQGIHASTIELSRQTKFVLDFFKKLNCKITDTGIECKFIEEDLDQGEEDMDDEYDDSCSGGYIEDQVGYEEEEGMGIRTRPNVFSVYNNVY
jgi:hypothetical protein